MAFRRAVVMETTSKLAQTCQVEGRLRELRVHLGRTLYRILYYGDSERTLVLLHAFEKRTSALPYRAGSERRYRGHCDYMV